MLLHLWLYPVFDLLVFPLLYLWNGISLTVVSLAAGVVLILAYYYTSDQWGLAYYKDRLKEHQNRLLQGDYSLETITGLIRDNLNLSWYGLIPAIFTVIPILVLIPWIGSRFGLETLTVNRPFAVTVESTRPFRLSLPEGLRVDTRKRDFNAGRVRLRMLAETSGTKHLTVTPDGSEPLRIPLRVNEPRGNAWPTLSTPRWYHSLIAPAGRVLPAGQPVESVRVSYPETVRWLSLNVPGMARLPGWLNYFFVVSFISGLAIKWSYSIE